MKKNINRILLAALVLGGMACSRQPSGENRVELVPEEECLSFRLPDNVSTYIKSMQCWKDGEGVDHLVLANNNFPEIYVYDLYGGQLRKTVRYHMEGPDGVGPKSGGVYMQDWNTFCLPNLFAMEIAVIDSAGHKRATYRFPDDAFPFIPTRSITSYPLCWTDSTLYAYQGVNPRLGEECVRKSPVGLKCDLRTGAVEPLAFHYPSSLCRSPKAPALGIESKVSRCFDGRRFVYSFAFDERLYVLPPSHDEVQAVSAPSRYLPVPEVPEPVEADLFSGTRQMCELPFYGAVYYDPYREVYYRIAYPKEEYAEEENFKDLWQSGRSRFSVLVLDKELRVIGETMLPKDTYRSDLVLVGERGLYFSESHYKNPSFDEDVLKFRLFRLENL